MDGSRADRLALRPLRSSDADALFPTMADPEAMRWWSRAPFVHVGELRDHFTPSDGSPWRSWAILRTGEDDAIGVVSAGRKREGVSEIGYLLSRDAQGRGYAREAVAMLIDRLIAEGHRRVFADTDPENRSSIALLTRLGFTLEGRLRAEWRTHIGVRDSLIYGLLAEEWRRPEIGARPLSPPGA
ncbi:GNAT family N-acetyltransferase [Acetobacteraceae bacterium KSS8]|uniref:GNAT family N-acetyltransferase n=1 Tax=Endosaccharibacter trunci TaxID=2812733 RepID=A0ABT1W9T3_9PROT|nr:GNAT family N-acetyltransferase [Acetobacteraceae bacterium KSS8]